MKPKTLREFMERVPPYVCRIMAVESGSGRETARIPEKTLVERSGLSRRTIIRLSYKMTWINKAGFGVDSGIASRFIEACGVNIFTKDPIGAFLRRYGRGKRQHMESCKYLHSRQRIKLETIWRHQQTS